MYWFSTSVSLPFDEAIERTREALAAEGFGVLSDIDVAETLRVKLGTDMPAYRILGACNPPLAHKALSAEPTIGTLLPCNVVVRDVGDAVEIDFMDPAAAMELTESATISEIGREVKAKLERVAASLAS